MHQFTPAICFRNSLQWPIVFSYQLSWWNQIIYFLAWSLLQMSQLFLYSYEWMILSQWKQSFFFSIYWQTFFSPLVTVLARVKLSFTDTVIRFEHLPKDTVTGIGLEIHIKRYKCIAHFGIVMDEFYIVSVVVDSLKYF